MRYVGRGEAVRPARRPEAVDALAPPGPSADLRAVVVALHDDADGIDVPASAAVDRSLVPAFAAVLRPRHPWLDDEAVDALCWASRYRRMDE